MVDEARGHGTPTRSDYLPNSGTSVGSSLLSGCAGSNRFESASTTIEPDTVTDTFTETTTSDSSYSVTISPVGTIEFKTTTNVMAFSQHYDDMLNSLAQSDTSGPGLRYFFSEFDNGGFIR